MVSSNGSQKGGFLDDCFTSWVGGDCNLFSSLDGRIDRGIYDWWDHWMYVVWMEWAETDG